MKIVIIYAEFIHRKRAKAINFVLRVFIYNDQLLRGSLSINGEVERREGLVGMFGMSLSAGRWGEQQFDGRRTMPAPVSAELQIGRKR